MGNNMTIAEHKVVTIHYKVVDCDSDEVIERRLRDALSDMAHWEAGYLVAKTVM